MCGCTGFGVIEPSDHLDRERDELLTALAALVVDESPERLPRPYVLSEGRAIFYVDGVLDHAQRWRGRESHSGFSFAIDARHGAFGLHTFLWYLLDEELLERMGAPVASEVMWGLLAPELAEVATFHQEGYAFLHLRAISAEPAPLDRALALRFPPRALEDAVAELPRLFALADARLAERFLRWWDSAR